MTEMNGINALALNSNWLEPMTSGGVPQAGSVIQTPLGTYGTWSYYPEWCYPVNVAIPVSRPIKLTLSEIERLRKAAKADATLKAILAKFTHQIEITVDFD